MHKQKLNIVHNTLAIFSFFLFWAKERRGIFQKSESVECKSLKIAHLGNIQNTEWKIWEKIREKSWIMLVVMICWH